MVSRNNEFREIKVDLSEVQIVMVEELIAARGAITRSSLIRSLILDAFISLKHSIPMNPQYKAMSIPVKTQSGEFLAVIDTGSNHTVVPEKYAEGFVFIKSRPVWTFGAMINVSFYEGEVEVMEKKILVERAVLTKGEVGLLGLDALEHLEVLVRGGKATVKTI